MDAEQTRAFLLRLPHVEETMQWGANLVYWTGDKAIGGKMFALVNLDNLNERKPDKPAPVLSFYAGPERCAELLESDLFMPAPYFARAHWIALRQWRGASRAQTELLLRQAHAGVLDRLPARVQALLALPKAAQDKLVAEHRASVAAQYAGTEKAQSRRTKKLGSRADESSAS